MVPPNRLNTHQKALSINIDARKYGTFAEIGAGQEVVRWFFHVGGAAGTVAKSVSAYDMAVSDAIYGKSERYVSRQRLLQMLDHEFHLNTERLAAGNKHLFAFADTVSARSFRGNNQCHGWMGLRFQHEAGASPSQVLIHVRMLDRENVAQQSAIGVVGVNLMHGAFYHASEPSSIITGLLDGLSPERIEVDVVEFLGPAFGGVDNRLMALQLVRQGLSEVAMFDADGQVLQPSDVLYKLPLLVERGSFRPVTKTHLDIAQSGYKQFSFDVSEKAKNIKVLLEITMKNLLETADLDPADFLSRADVLAVMGQPVLITKFSEYFKLVSYLGRHTAEPIALAIGAGALKEIFKEEYYQSLEGKALEGLGKLFRSNVTVYVYPQMQRDGVMLRAENFEPMPELRDLYQYLLKKGAIRTVQENEIEFSAVTSQNVIELMRAGDRRWENLVPEKVVTVIKQRKLFGYLGQ